MAYTAQERPAPGVTAAEGLLTACVAHAAAGLQSHTAVWLLPYYGQSTFIITIAKIWYCKLEACLGRVLDSRHKAVSVLSHVEANMGMHHTGHHMYRHTGHIW